jgi:predicted MFS family arabinose efflux permease
MVSCAFLLALRLPRRVPRSADTETGPSADRSVRRRPVRVAAIIALSTVYYLVYGPFETASPGFVRDQLSGGEGTYSLIWALFGAGALLSLPVAPMLARRRPGLVNGAGALVWGLAMLPLFAIDHGAVAAVVFFIGGILWGPYTTVETSALQRWVHPSQHGTVFGLQRSLLATATPVGAALGALAVDAFSPGSVLLVAAASCALAGAAALLNTDLRRAR